MRARLCLCAVLAAAAAVPMGAADRPWRLLTGPNVAVAGPQSAKTLRGIALQIEQFREVVTHFLRGSEQPLSMPTVIYAFDGGEAMRPFVPLFQGKPVSLHGYCYCGSGADANFILYDLHSFAGSSAVVYHEYTHQLVHNAVTSIPAWLNEGFAEYFSTFQILDGRRARIGGAVPAHVALLRERVMPVAELLAVTRTSKDYNEGSRRGVFYAEAWALTHYLLMERPDGQAAVMAYLAALQDGVRDQDAFRSAFKTTVAQLDVELRRYVGRFAFKSIEYTSSGRMDLDVPDTAVDLPPADLEARLGDIQRRVGRVAEAAPRIERAAAAEPPLPQAQLALALLRKEQGREDEAKALLRKAAALAPGDFLVQFTLGLTLLHGAGPEASGPDLERARDAMAKAVAINPRSADALALLAYADALREQPLDEALASIEKAVEIAPGRLDYRMKHAEILVMVGRPADAKPILATLVTAKDEELARIALALMERVEAEERVNARRAGTERARSEPGATEPPRFIAGQRVALRRVRPDEQRVFGDLVDVKCDESGVQFHLRVGTRLVVASAPELAAVEATAVARPADFTLGCGARTPPDPVFLTWKMGQQHVAGAATLVGRAVAVEFVPRGYVP